ncbi:MAG TPA: APC family permease [Pyrinomonadaceae bacterium]|nr:APC family permease [Pyrinomonadaceae bacterium]
MGHPVSGTSEGRMGSGLLRILGVSFGVAVIIGGTIGSGILRGPGEVAALLGRPWLIIAVWAAVGVYALLGANYLAELATALPKAGGPYVYAQRAYGDFGGFVVGYSDWIVNTASLAYVPIAFGEYAVALVPSLAGREKAIAVAVIVVFTILNWVGLRAGSGTQQLTSLVKTVGLLAFIVACFAFGGQADTDASRFPPVATPSSFAALLVALGLSFRLVHGTYLGWNAPVYFAEEDTRPGRNLPRSLFGGVLIVMFIYVLINVAYMYVLPLPQFAASKLPAADAMQLIWGPRGGQVVTILALLVLLSLINAVFMLTPRTIFALGRDRLFSAHAVRVNVGGTPFVALGVTAVAAIILAAYGEFGTLFGVSAFFGVTNDVLLTTSLFVLRRREPDLPRPYRARGYPWLPLLFLLAGVALFVAFIASDPRHSLFSLAGLAASVPVYLFIKSRKK